MQAVDRVDVGLRRGLDNVRGSTPPDDLHVLQAQLDDHLTLRVLALGDGPQGVIQQLRREPGDAVDRLVAGIHRPVAAGGILDDFVVLGEPDGGGRHAVRAGARVHVRQLVDLLRLRQHVLHNGGQILVEDFLFLVG